MKKLLLLIQKKHRQVYLLFLFALSAVAILYVYPGQVQFKYDFQRGKAWVHETLEAPFTFTIQKTEKTLKDEEQKLKDKRAVFFNRDAQVEINQTAKIFTNWNRIALPDSVKRRDSAQVVKVMGFLYAKGIVESIEEFKLPKQHEFFLTKENKVERFLPEDYYTIESASKLLANALHSKALFNETSTYLIPNIEYNQERTQEYLADKIAGIVKNRGVVKQGELIIIKGAVVDDEKFLILSSLRKAYEQNLADESFPFQLVAGQLIYILLLFGVLYSFIFYFRRTLFNYIANVNLILFTIVWMVVLAILLIKFNTPLIYIVPFPIVPIIMRAFFDTRIALFVHIITIFLVGYYAPNSFEFLVIEFVAGMSAIINVSGLYKRSQLFFAAAKIIGVYLLAYGAFILLEEGEVANEQFVAMGFLMASGVFSLFAFPLIYVYEKVFGQVSDLTLLELADTNSPLLRELAQKAPGTFHHSVQVANLAEIAALTIEANTLLVRTGALYHDIGKMHAPMYFVENQSTGVNPHDELSFDESANIIINHVIDGVKMAKKNRLPDLIVDFIRTHHGTSRVEYFYRQYIKSFPDETQADEMFRYPGPLPFSKETAILMMADSVEASSRSLKEKSTEKLNELVDGIIDSKLSQGQFDNANITLKEIADIKQVLKRQLANIYHARIEYPEKMK